MDNVFKQFIIADSDDDDTSSEGMDDGFDDAMAVEEQYEEKVETLQSELRLKLHSGEQVLIGNVRGVWNMYSPRYLDLREVNSRQKRWATGSSRNYNDWKTGTLKVGDEYGDASTFGTDTVGSLHLDGFENDWHVYMNIPQLATLETRMCTAVKQASSGREPRGAEVHVGVCFLGDGCLKIKVPSISLAGQEEWNRYITLYGVLE
jgi:hypothetical protein